MQIKYPNQLQTGDIFVHNKKRYICEKYTQGSGMGSFIWGNYGIIRCIQFHEYWFTKMFEGTKEILSGPQEIQVYEDYPLVVMTPEEASRKGSNFGHQVS